MWDILSSAVEDHLDKQDRLAEDYLVLEDMRRSLNATFGDVDPMGTVPPNRIPKRYCYDD